MKQKKLLYVDVAQNIKKDILDGKYPVGSYIPTERELEEMFGVSKITVRNAVEILSNEGYLEKKSGKGTTVLSNRLFNKLSKANSFSTILENDHNVKKELMGIEVTRNLSEDIIQEFGDHATCLKRMYYLDGNPYIYLEHYFPEMPIKNAINEIEHDSLYKWLSQKGYDVARFSDKFYIEHHLDPMVAKILGVGDRAVLCRQRSTYDYAGNCIEVSYGYYDSDKHPYIVEYEI